MSDNECKLDITGIDAPIANALRRIMIAEIPTVAIERVLLYQNTSILADEVLVHRLGLIPLLIDPSLLEFKTPEEEYNERNSIKLSLNVKCENKNNIITNEIVYAKQLMWVP
jgi:DNA-directed RNA polymerase I and III subunit RPAC1